MPEQSATGSGALTGNLKDLKPAKLQRDGPVYFSTECKLALSSLPGTEEAPLMFFIHMSAFVEKCPEVLLYVDFLLLHTEQFVFVREQNVLLMRKIRATNSW